jgi:hypothetical protein
MIRFEAIKFLFFLFALTRSDLVLAEKVSVPHRISYYKNGEIHVNQLGKPDAQPLTSGHWDFKPSWSKTDDKLVFFRRFVNAPEVWNWKTAICIINADGTGFHQITNAKKTNFNQTWTRDGTNRPIWNRRNPSGKGYHVMISQIGAKPGDEVALTDPKLHNWVYTCMKDGRVLVNHTDSVEGRGYYLMKPKPNARPVYERIRCELAEKGYLDRLSLSVDEKKICFEFQKGFNRKVAGRVLYLADFDQERRLISNFKAIANKDEKPAWFAYPRWTRDQSGIVYHAAKSLYLYDLKSEETKMVSMDPKGDYRYPHGEGTPK